MSEAERKKRLSYKENRKRWIFIQGVALIVVAVLIFASVITYNQLNKEYYINYTESSGVDYRVKIKPGTPFYDDYKDYYANEAGEVWLKSGEAYPASAVEVIVADVNYELNMDARDVDYEYSYKVYATAEVVDSVTKNKFNMPVIEIKSESTHAQNSNNKLFVHEEVNIDYNQYNDMVKNFTDQLGITKSTSTLIVTMEVNVIGSSTDFASNSQNRHTVNISVPLTEQSFKVDYSSSVPTGESKVLAYKNAGNQHLYRGAAVTLGAVELLLLAIFIAFVYLTRNHDVNYSIKVQRLVNNYRSFIQQVTNGFDVTGYQIVAIASFREMLSIRDTIQSPVLMSENTDQTRTQFFIPTNTKILYLFEIKVDNYDELYGSHPEWVDDSLVTITSLDADEPESIPVIEDPKSSLTDELVLKLFAEIEKLKEEIQSPTEPAPAPAPTPAPAQILQCAPMSCPGGNATKIGNFSAQGNVIINYNEKPSEEIIAETAKRIAETLGTVKIEENTEECKPIVDEMLVIDEPEESEEIFEESVHEVIPLISEEEGGAKIDLDSAPESEAVIAEPTLEDEIRSEESTHVEAFDAPIEAEEITVTEAPAEESASEPEIFPVEIEPIAEEGPKEESVEHKTLDLDHVLNDLEYDEEHGYFLDEEGNPLTIQCRRSFTANIIQADPETVKYYYSELKNYALSFKGVKARMSWRYEAFKKGRDQLLRMKIRGKSICLYCALDPEKFDKTKYFQEAIDAKMFESVPMLVKIKSPRGLKRAMELIDATMEKFGIAKDPKAKRVDYVAEHPFEKTKALVEKGLIKILDNDYIINEPKAYKNPEIHTAEAIEDPMMDVTPTEYETIAEPTLAEEAEAIVAMEESEMENASPAEELPESIEEIPLLEVEFDEAGEIVIPEGKKLNIHCKRSFAANIIQSDPATVKTYYSELKNYILSFKGLKANKAWRYESYKKGRNQLFRIRVKGKGLCLYCALDPKDVDESRYFHDVITAKDYADVPTMVRIKTTRGLKRAKELVDAVMKKFDIQPNPKAKTVDYLEVYPFRKTVELVEAGYIKILSDSYKIKEPKAPKQQKAKKTAAKK